MIPMNYRRGSKRIAFKINKRFKENSFSFIEAHRGLNKEEPENTLIAFEEAIKANCDSIELDIWLTKDKIPVIIHGVEDSGEISQTLKGSGFIHDFTLEEIKHFKTKEKEMQIPTLEEVLVLCKDRCFVNIELKDPQCEETFLQVEKLLENYSMFQQVMISSFNHDYWKEIKKSPSPIEFGFLYERKLGQDLNIILNSERENTSINLWYHEIDQQLVTSAHKLGIGVLAWFYLDDIETDEIINNLLDWGVDVICSNYPRKALEKISKKKATI